MNQLLIMIFIEIKYIYYNTVQLQLTIQFCTVTSGKTSVVSRSPT